MIDPGKLNAALADPRRDAPQAAQPDADAPEQGKDLKPDPGKLHSKWLEEITSAEKALSPFFDRASKIVKLYTKEEKSAGSASNGKRRFAILWSNIATLQPSVYARVPEPVVQRRYRDRDPVGRQVSELMERALSYSQEAQNIDLLFKAVRDDYLLVARGTSWMRYEPTIEQVPAQAPDAGQAPDPEAGEAPDNEAAEAPEMQEVITDEKVIADYVHWRDFIYPAARTWNELPWVARKAYMTRDEVRGRFGKEAAASISLDHVPNGVNVSDTNLPDSGRKATVYEIWSKVDKKCIWISTGATKVLDYCDPILTFKDFFPCPRPAFGTLATDSLIPVPDYVYYQDQVEEIDDITDRIAAVTDMCKLVGWYPSGPSSTGSVAIEQAIKGDNVLVAIPNWGDFVQKGGSSQIQWLPIDQVVKLLEGLFNTRKQLVEDIYQITGISDIVRGDTDPNETKGAQVIKAQWGNIRLRDRQQELSRFARDVTRLMGEIIADKFQPDTLSRMTGIQLPWQAELDQQYQQQMVAYQQQALQLKLQAQAQQAAQAQQQVPMAPAGPAQPDPGAPAMPPPGQPDPSQMMQGGPPSPIPVGQ